jgi:hypothetical protein
MNNCCPKCDSDQWKSAKLVILEGTNRTEGKIEGEIIKKGSLNSVDPRDWFLADQWFSYEDPFHADIKTTTNSILVDQVKEMMINAASDRPMPIPPVEPQLSILKPEPKKILPQKPYFFNLDPKNKNPIKPPNKPEDPVTSIDPFEPRSWLSHLVGQWFRSLLWILFIVALMYYFFPTQSINTERYFLKTFDFVAPETDGFSEISTHITLNIPKLSDWILWLELETFWLSKLGILTTVIFLWLAKIVLQFPSSFGLEKKRKQKHQERVDKAEVERDLLFEKYNADIENHKGAVAARDLEIKEFELTQSKYNTELKAAEDNYKLEQEEYEKEVNLENSLLATRKSEYLRQFSDYEAQCMQIRSFRSELWDRARMCTRCGTMYLGATTAHK